ncbi:MAG: lysophospholipid acyltransferase family protein [Planctomycetota bacterium]|nr:lysophospholipid acyltransferase family protein [Planctomycetota bacterium]MDI6787065.1 lysophospholipid acyltransferase family protein [Planctomycetota bacterium]
MLYFIVHKIGCLLAIIFFRLRVYGRNNIPEKGGSLLTSNHQSYLDPALISFVINRPVYFLARKELFEANRLFGWLISQLNAIPIERKEFDSSGVRRAIEILRKGKLLIVFPEGTRTLNGQIGEVKKGIGLLGTRANVPLIPTFINGAYQSWPRQHKLPRRLTQITVSFNKPLWLDKNNTQVISQIWEQLSRRDKKGKTN